MLIALRNAYDLALSDATDTIDMDVDGNVSLLADNRHPGQYLQTFEAGEPEGHALQRDMPEPITAYHINISKVNQGRRTMTRQNTTAVPADEGVWRSDGPIVSGVRMEGADKRKPSTPIVEAVGAGTRGFEAGTYGYAVGFSDARRQPTTATDMRYFELASNQRPTIPVPEEKPDGARYLDVYMTKRGGGPNTLALQAKVNLERLRGKTEYVIRGPLKDGSGPPGSNQSGVGTPHPPRVGREVRIMPSRFDLAAGTYRVFYQIHIPGKGSSLLSVASGAITVRGTRELVEFEQEDGTTVEFMADGPFKKRSGIAISAPLYARRTGYRWTAWVLHEPPENAESTGMALYRAYPKRNRFGSSTYFTANHRSITVHGYGPDAEPRGLAAGLTSEEAPTEDGTIVEAPEPTSVPDEAIPGGTETPGAGRYLVSVTGQTESEALTRDSEAVSVTLGTSQTIRVRLGENINLLPNAEFRRIGADGVPEGWTPVNMGSGFACSYSVNRGVLRMGTTSTTSFPRMDSAAIRLSKDAPLTIAGSINVTRHASGEARVVIRQESENGALIREPGVFTLSTAGAAPFAVTYGAGYSPLEQDTAQIRVLLQIRTTDGTGANLDMEVRDLQALGLPTALRKLQNGSFDTSAAVPVPAHSYIAAAPPPTPVGSEPVEPQPPLSFVDFEDQTWPAEWSESGSGATGSITTNAALWQSYGYRVQDLDQSVAGSRFRDFGVSGSSAALRSLVRVTVAHSTGDVFFNAIRASRSLAFWRLDSSMRLWIWYWTGSEYKQTLVAALSTGEKVDLEVIVSGVGTNDGQVSAGVGRGEPRRTVVEIGGLDYRSFSLARASAGVTSSNDNRARFTLDFDQVVVTEKGDILNRETSESPSGVTPPLPDAPLLNGEPRLYDEDGERIGQVYAFIAPEEGPVRKPLLDRPLAVKPGFSYTSALFARWVSFTENLSRVLVHLEGDEVERRTFSLLDMEGQRGWHPTLEEDDYRTFTVPEGYTRLWYELVLHGGVFVFAEFLNSQGSYEDFAARDARRGYGREAAGELTTVLPSFPPLDELAPRLGHPWADFGLTTASDSEETPTVYATSYYATSSDGVLFSSETGDPALVEPNKYLRTRVEFVGDGRDTPAIPSGGIFLRTFCPFGMLLRADGSSFDGGAYVGNHAYPTRYPDIEAESVGGHHVSVIQSEEIGRVLNIPITVFTESAAREIERLSLQEEMLLELPQAEGTGRSLTVRFREQVNFEPAGPARVHNGQTNVLTKAIYATAEVEEAEILENGPLAGPMVVEGSEVSA